MQGKGYTPLAEVVGQGDILEEAFDNSGGLEGGGGLLDDGNHGYLSGKVEQRDGHVKKRSAGRERPGGPFR